MKSIVNDSLEMIHSSTPSSSPTHSWQHWKRVGDEHYQRGHFDDALQAYRRSLLDTTISSIDKSIVLSNMVACRLSLGGPAHARAAVQDAQQCVALNPTWGKAYWRLGSALSASGDDSNAACNALQTCLRLDPSCTAARKLLVQELKRETTSHNSRANNDHDKMEPSDDTIRDRRPPPQNPSYREESQQNQSTAEINNNTPRRQSQQPQSATTIDIDLEQELSVSDRVVLAASRTYQQLAHAYAVQSETRKSLWKLGLVLVLLYVAFGGRFGLEYLQPSQPAAWRYGHYDPHDNNNPYTDYRRQTTTEQQQQHDTYHHDNSYQQSRTSSSSSYSSRLPDDDYAYTRQPRRNRGSWWNWGSSSHHHGGGGSSGSRGRSSILSLSYLALGGTAYFIYRQYGFYAAAMFVLNQYRYGGMQGHHRWGGGGGGGGMYGGRARRRGW